MYTHQWEQAVQHYLTVDRSVFVNPQYLIGERKIWEAWADFLAIDFRNKKIWVVEITTGNGRGIIGKMFEFDNIYVPKIKEQILSNKIVTLANENNWGEWEFGLWVFAPKHTCDSLHRRFPDIVNHLQVTHLENIAYEWNWYDDRFK